MLRRWGLVCAVLVGALLARAQEDALNLPTALYTLANEGVVQRYGLGTEGLRTVTPEGVFVVDFGVAPDDRWLAYRTEAGLFLREMYRETDTMLDGPAADTPPLRGRGDTVAWSPDGMALAVTTATGVRVYFVDGAPPLALTEGQALQVSWSPDSRFLAAETDSGAWWIYRRDGATIALTSAVPAASGLAWDSAAGALLFAPAAGGLVRMNLDLANAQTPLLGPDWIAALPFARADGAVAFLGRRADDSSVAAGYGRPLILPLGAAVPEPLGEALIELADLRWAPGGQLLVKFQDGVFALIEPTSGQGFPLPVGGAVAYGWGPPLPEGVTGLALPADGFFLAQIGAGPAQVWRLPADGAPPAPITLEEGGVSSFGVAPDGRRIVYSSGTRLLLLRLDENDAEPVEIVALAADKPAQPVFSPDGSRVAYVDGGALWLLALAEGTPRRLAEGSFAEPTFAPDVNALLVTLVTETTDGQPALVDPTSSEVIPLGAPGQLAQWLPGGRIALYGPQAGFSVVSVQALEQPAALLPSLVDVDAVGLASAERLRVSLPARGLGPSPLRVIELDSASGAVDRDHVFVGGYLLGPVFSPGASHVAGYRWQDSAGRGPLTVRELAAGRQFTLVEPPLVWNFTWAQR